MGKWQMQARFAQVLLVSLASLSRADDFARLCADRRDVERVYYVHRLGVKPPFEQALPPESIERLVRQMLKEEIVLKRVYGREIAPAEIAAEVQRIDKTTRAPDMLAELKRAVDNDPVRFARVLVKPVLVDRELRERFDSDDRIHSEARKRMEDLHRQLLGAKANGWSVDDLVALAKKADFASVYEMDYPFRSRSSNETSEGKSVPVSNVMSCTGGPYAVQAYAGIAQPSFDPYNGDSAGSMDDSFAGSNPFSISPLAQPGAIRPVRESPSGFAFDILRAGTASGMKAVMIRSAKRSFEEWLAAQPDWESGGREPTIRAAHPR